MAVQKSRKTPSKRGMHRSHARLKNPALSIDSQSGESHLRHCITPDLVFPNAGVMLQGRLGNLGCPALGVEAACSGFIYALSLADKFIRAGEAKLALVVGAESLSKITNYNDRGTAILFGDGAGAVLLAPDAEPGILSTHLHADGSYLPLLRCTGGVSAGHAPDGDFITMAGSEVFKGAVYIP